jgi:hypothetical protein
MRRRFLVRRLNTQLQPVTHNYSCNIPLVSGILQIVWPMRWTLID